MRQTCGTLRHRGWLAPVAVCCGILGGLAVPPAVADAKSSRGALRLSVRAQSASEHVQKLVVALRGRPRARCTGVVRVRKSATKLPSIRLSVRGAGSWEWLVPAEAPSGTWTFAAKCSRGRGLSKTSRKLMILTGSKSARGPLVTPSTGHVGDGAAAESAATGRGGANPSNPFLHAGYWGECTWYAWERRPDMGNIALGHARSWLDAANGKKPTGTLPVVGAIAVQRAWVGGTGAFGHVSYVEQVFPDGTFEVSEFNWAGVHVGPTRRRVGPSGVSGFIYGGPAGNGPTASASPTPAGPGGPTGGATNGSSSGTPPVPEAKSPGTDLLQFEPFSGGAWTKLNRREDGTLGWDGFAIASLGTPARVVRLDYNRDGLMDILQFEPFSGGSWTRVRNNGDGTFGWDGFARRDLGTPTHVVTIDYNRDGLMDILQFEPFSGGSWTRVRNNGDGTFGWDGFARRDLGTPTHALTFDYNRDGLMDILQFEPFSGGSWTRVRNNGDGTFGWDGFARRDLGTPTFATAGSDVSGPS